MVEVSNKHKSITVGVSSNNGNTIVTAKSDTSQYWANQSHTFADQAKESAQEAKNYAELANSYIEGFENVVTNNTNNIIATSNDCINQLNTTKEEVTEEINATVASGKDEINSAKTTILNDIEFVADGEKKEIEDLADLIKENAEEIANRTSFAMFDTVLKDHVLTYEEAKGLALQGTYVYKEAVAGSRYGYADFYNKCLEEYNEATATETVNGISVKVHSNGHKFYDIANKTAIDDFFNTMGSAWFYGVDTKNERIFLPRNNYFEQATADVSEVGKSVEAGLPNITGGFNVTTGAPHWCTGAFRNNNAGQSNQNNGGYNASREGATFDASRSSSVYKNDVDTVQPPAVKKLLYICVGNTVSDTSWVDVVTQVEGGVKDLEDKTLEGIERLKASSTALTQTQITNCLLEVPQRIKLELNNGVLTLKAGSKVIVPNGFEADGTTPKFDYVVVESDVQHIEVASGDNRIIVYFGNSNTLDGYQSSSVVFSGSTAPTIPSGTNYALWYDTANNIIKSTNNGGAVWAENEGIALPLGTGTYIKGTGFTSINQVFNGIGYIGSTVWVDKGVKGLIPNGRNEDGTLNNIGFVTDKLLRNTSFNTNANVVEARLVYNGSDITLTRNTPSSANFYFDYKNNYYHRPDGTQKTSIDAVTMSTTTNGIQTFEPKLPFRAVDYNDFANTPHIIETYVNGTSWYRIWSDGWCEQGGVVSVASNATGTITLLKGFKSAIYNCVFTIQSTETTVNSSGVGPVWVTNKNATSITFINDTWAGSLIWEAKGYIA